MNFGINVCGLNNGFNFSLEQVSKADAILFAGNSMPFSYIVSGRPETFMSLATFTASHRDLELPGTRLRRTFFDFAFKKNDFISLFRVFRRLLFSSVLFAIVFLSSRSRLLILFLMGIGILISRTLSLSGMH